MSARLRFTLVTSAHVANNPRLVKEADALVEAGHEVRVVAPLQHDYLAARDDALLARRGWRLTRVDVGRRSPRGRWRWVAGAASARAARALHSRGATGTAVAERALTRHLGAMLRAATAAPADVVIGHNLPALPVAGRAAERLRARLGFDIEDLHSGELPDEPAFESERRLIEAVERHWLPRCDLLTASSEGIADEIVRRYAVRRPCVVLNVFPLVDRLHPVPDRAERPHDARVSLYWYSQVIGPGRGLEEALTALAALPSDVHLSLRGERDARFVTLLTGEARRLGVAERLHLLAPALPGELVARAAVHDVGLALEQPGTRNRELCVTNKIFTYLLAGLAVAATDTEGQRGVMEEARGAGFLCPAGDAGALARGLADLTQPARLSVARAAAAESATTRFHWERERLRLVEYLTSPSSGGTAGCAAS